MGPLRSKTSLRLWEFFILNEVSPFASQATTTSTTSTTGGTSMAVTKVPHNGVTAKNLSRVEDLLHNCMQSGDSNTQPNKIINQFLVDIVPFLE